MSSVCPVLVRDHVDLAIDLAWPCLTNDITNDMRFLKTCLSLNSVIFFFFLESDVSVTDSRKDGAHNLGLLKPSR